MCSGSRDCFKFWKICDDIWKMMQDRDKVAMEIVCGLLNGTITGDF